MVEFKVTVSPIMSQLMKVQEKRILASINSAVKESTLEVKDAMREHIANRLTPRAGYLITDAYYQDRNGVLVGYLHSRWFRGARGGKVRNTPNALGVNDILAIHAQGGTIRPVRAKGLLISGARGKQQRFILSRALRRDAQRAASGGKTRLGMVPTKGGVALVERSGKNKGSILATLVQQVRIPKRLDLDAIARQAQRMLRQRLLAGFERD